MRAMTTTLRPIALGMLLSALAAAAWAQEQTFQGTLGGESREWTILEQAGQSTASFGELMPGMVTVTIQGHDGPRFSVQGALSISFMTMNEQIGDLEVMYFPESAMLPHYTSIEPTGLEIERFEVEGDTARLAGRYRGTLRYMEAFGATPDPARSLEVDVRFDLEAARE